METSAMASMMAMPRVGHLDTVLHMFAFLKSKRNGVMVLDPTESDIDLTSFRTEDWSTIPYGICEEEALPPNASISLRLVSLINHLSTLIVLATK